jgi:hypothetical protein
VPVDYLGVLILLFLLLVLDRLFYTLGLHLGKVGRASVSRLIPNVFLLRQSYRIFYCSECNPGTVHAVSSCPKCCGDNQRCKTCALQLRTPCTAGGK